MTIALILVIAGVGAAATAFGLTLGGRRAQAAAIGGVLALIVIALLAVAGAGPTTASPGADPSIPAGSAWGGVLVPGAYLQLVIGLVGAMAALLAVMGWLLGGFCELPGLLPAMLAAVGGMTVAVAASDPVVAAIGATGTGLVAVPLVLARRRVARTFPALRELRASLITGVLVVVAAAVTAVVTRIVFADPSAVIPETGSPAAAAAGLAALALGLAVAVRSGAVPFHLRLARLADAAPPLGLPVVAAWIPLPLTVAALAVANGLLAPLAFPLDGERAALVILALIGLGGAALAAFITDDLRHAVAYLIAADSTLAMASFAALDPGTWGPARAWLVIVLVSKTALGAWGAVLEERFATRSVPDLRGWARRAPVLGAAFVIIGIATFGLPGWVGFDVRYVLPQTAVAGPWATLLMVAGFLSLPTYVRFALLGVGEPAANMHRAEPERFRHYIGYRAQDVARRLAGLGPAIAAKAGRSGSPVRPVPAVSASAEHAEASPSPAANAHSVAGVGAAAPVARAHIAGQPLSGAMQPRSVASAAVRARAGLRAAASLGRTVVPSADEVRRGRTELLSAAVLLLALLGALLAMGGLDINHAAAEGNAGAPAGLEGN